MKYKFPRISDAEIKEGVCVGPKIRKLIRDVKFGDQLIEVEKAEIIKNATSNLGWGGENHKADIVIWWLILYSPTKLYFLPENLGAMSDENG